MVQAAAGKRSQGAIFYFQFQLLAAALLENSIQRGKDAFSELLRGGRVLAGGGNGGGGLGFRRLNCFLQAFRRGCRDDGNSTGRCEE